MARSRPMSDVLPELVATLGPGEELILTIDGEPAAIVTRPPRTSWPSQPGSARDRSFWMAPDFDATLDDFPQSRPDQS